MLEVEYTNAQNQVTTVIVDANMIRDSKDGLWVDLHKHTEFVQRFPSARVLSIKVVPDDAAPQATQAPPAHPPTQPLHPPSQPQQPQNQPQQQPAQPPQPQNQPPQQPPQPLQR